MSLKECNIYAREKEAFLQRMLLEKELIAKNKEMPRRVYIDGKSLVDLMQLAREHVMESYNKSSDDFDRIYNEIIVQYPFLKQYE